MRTFLLSLLLCFSAVAARADIEGAPFLPEEDVRFNAIEQGNHYKQYCVPAGSCDGHYAKQTAQATYDFTVNGGSSTVNSGTVDLGVALPAKATILRSYLYVNTQPQTSNSGTLAFFCQTANNIKTATAAASWATGWVDGAATGASSVFGDITAACNISAKIATGALTAGKVTAYVEYVTHK